jgi:cell division septal protein FtsQ
MRTSKRVRRPSKIYAAELTKGRATLGLAHPKSEDRAKVSGFILLGFFFSLTLYLTISKDFSVSDPLVVGTRFLSQDQVIQAAGIEGHNIFLIDPRRVAEDVQTLPDIATARVSLRLPNRLVIDIVEREPYLAWRTSEGTYYLDRRGIVLSPRKGITLSLTIEDLGGGPLQVGSRINPQVLDAATTYSSLLPEVVGFQYSEAYGLIAMRGQFEVRLGDAQGAEAKAELMRALIEELLNEGQEGGLIDLRFEGRPYLRPGGGA